MIKIARGACPASLDGPTSAGGEEMAAAIAHFSTTPPTGEAPDFVAYTSDDVRPALRAMFGAKCAYCETEYAPGSRPDAEHYRPKKPVKLEGGGEVGNGYYWLAAEWKNLLPTCIYCNRPHGHPYDGDPHVTGKGSLFPLLDETKRALLPGEEVDEEPVLLDPTEDEPMEHLYFGDEGIVKAAEAGGGPSLRGEGTIDLLGLNRDDLVKARNREQHWVDTTIERLLKAERRLEQEPENPYFKEDRDEARDELETRARDDQPYAAMVRQRLIGVL